MFSRKSIGRFLLLVLCGAFVAETATAVRAMEHQAGTLFNLNANYFPVHLVK